MKKVFYERRVSPGGRVRYVPISEYDSEYLDSFPKGNHLVMVYPGGQSRKYNVNPDYAAMIAAGRLAEEVISHELMKASDLRLSARERGRPMTQAQREAWLKLIEEFGEGARQLEWPAAREITEAGVQAMINEAEKLLKNPTLKEAWDHFQTLCLLIDQSPPDK